MLWNLMQQAIIQNKINKAKLVKISKPHLVSGVHQNHVPMFPGSRQELIPEMYKKVFKEKYIKNKILLPKIYNWKLLSVLHF